MFYNTRCNVCNPSEIDCCKHPLLCLNVILSTAMLRIRGSNTVPLHTPYFTEKLRGAKQAQVF